MRWAVGLTTVAERVGTLLPRTVESLAQGGFVQSDVLRVFADGVRAEKEVLDACPDLAFRGIPVTVRWPRVRTAGNWTLALWELYARDPASHYYAVFQDDFVCSRNLRPYLEATLSVDAKRYWNCYTFPSNQQEVPLDQTRERRPVEGWFEARQLVDGPVFEGGKRQQTGRGAVALVFNREGVIALLSSPDFVRRFTDSDWGWRRIDGGVVHCMNRLGYREHVHHPSLVQHTGAVSSMGNLPQKLACSFRGEGYDLLELMAKD